MKTPWFGCVAAPPVRVGWYDFRVNDASKTTRCWWDGCGWHIAQPCADHIDTRLYVGNRSQWRGIKAAP